MCIKIELYELQLYPFGITKQPDAIDAFDGFTVLISPNKHPRGTYVG